MEIPAGNLFLSGMDPEAPALARKWGLGLELTTFTYAPNLEDPHWLEEARKEMSGIGNFVLHAPFAELSPCAVDPLVREVAQKRFRQTLTMAQALGISKIVVHSGFIPYIYFPEWFVAESVRFWRDFLESVPENTVLCLENVMDPSPEMLVQVAEAVNDPRLRLCLDVGHANTCIAETKPMDWLDPMAPWLDHLHLHNNDGGNDLHASLDRGTIPMEALLEQVLTLCPEATLTLENQTCAPSLDALCRWGLLKRGTL